MYIQMHIYQVGRIVRNKINENELPYLNTTNTKKYNQHPDKPR